MLIRKIEAFLRQTKMPADQVWPPRHERPPFVFDLLPGPDAPPEDGD